MTDRDALGDMEDSLPGKFIVCVHDVCPQWETPLMHIMRRLADRIGNRFSSAVIPLPFGRQWNLDSDFHMRVQAYSGEIILHGLTHHRPNRYSPRSFLINDSDEFVRLSAEESERRIEKGTQILTQLFHDLPCGFIAPTWQSGKVTLPMLRRHGIQYIMGMASIMASYEHTIPLATWSWDFGRIGVLGWLGDLAGSCLMRLRPSMPCIVIHPADVGHGFLERGLGKIDALLEKGYQPILPREVIHP